MYLYNRICIYYPHPQTPTANSLGSSLKNAGEKDKPIALFRRAPLTRSYTAIYLVIIVLIVRLYMQLLAYLYSYICSYDMY